MQDKTNTQHQLSVKKSYNILTVYLEIERVSENFSEMSAIRWESKLNASQILPLVTKHSVVKEFFQDCKFKLHFYFII